MDYEDGNYPVPIMEIWQIFHHYDEPKQERISRNKKMNRMSKEKDLRMEKWAQSVPSILANHPMHNPDSSRVSTIVFQVKPTLKPLSMRM